MEKQSKSARKRELEALKKLAIAMSKLSDGQLATLNLPPDLYKAIIVYQKLDKKGAFVALGRQAKYLGKLMREADPELIEQLNAKVGQRKS